MAFRVEITAQAEQDADEILDWLVSKQAGEAGGRWFTALTEAIGTLSEYPGRCSIAAESGKLFFRSSAARLRQETQHL